MPKLCIDLINDILLFFKQSINGLISIGYLILEKLSYKFIFEFNFYKKFKENFDIQKNKRKNFK
jgi:hypothetical protein